MMTVLNRFLILPVVSWVSTPAGYLAASATRTGLYHDDSAQLLPHLACPVQALPLHCIPMQRA